MHHPHLPPAVRRHLSSRTGALAAVAVGGTLLALRYAAHLYWLPAYLVLLGWPLAHRWAHRTGAAAR
ncbi:hypothetical protein [Ramlibacter sp. Leaf400]|uniref:hypothetical protein n=1 Tax=Ramlibacter sp. Leaf400 TaxID=1736365 RepID=UPI0006F805D4|nr:hypothetical protein [Ramlibacter sp. Leaf400]KQT10848.1 hypothetical protein ASG30_08540 [Ramlibacter sp. Leaf400]